MPAPSSASFLFLGVLHLPPLPGAPRGSDGFAGVRSRALADARALLSGGATGFILENFGDAPFTGGAVEPHVVAAMAILASELRAAHPGALIGVNILRNDARAALGVAAVSDADFVRVNVLAGASVTDQGIVQGDAHAWLRYRREIATHARGVFIAADVHVKHASPLLVQPIGAAAHDLHARAGADVLIVTGQATGAAADRGDAEAVRSAVPGVPLWIGSGVNLENGAMWRSSAQGAIVGTALHTEADIRAPIDEHRVAALARVLLG